MELDNAIEPLLSNLFMCNYSSSNWTFIALNLPIQEDSKAQQNKKIASLGRQEPQPAGTAKWPTTLRFEKIVGTTSVVRSIENPQDVVQKIHRP